MVKCTFLAEDGDHGEAQQLCRVVAVVGTEASEGAGLACNHLHLLQLLLLPSCRWSAIGNK